MFDDFHPGLVAGLVGALISILLTNIFHGISVFRKRHRVLKSRDHLLSVLKRMAKCDTAISWTEELNINVSSWYNVFKLLKLNEIINEVAQLVAAEAAAQAVQAAQQAVQAAQQAASPAEQQPAQQQAAQQQPAQQPAAQAPAEQQPAQQQAAQQQPAQRPAAQGVNTLTAPMERKPIKEPEETKGEFIRPQNCCPPAWACPSARPWPMGPPPMYFGEMYWPPMDFAAAAPARPYWPPPQPQPPMGPPPMDFGEMYWPPMYFGGMYFGGHQARRKKDYPQRKKEKKKEPGIPFEKERRKEDEKKRENSRKGEKNRDKEDKQNKKNEMEKRDSKDQQGKKIEEAAKMKEEEPYKQNSSQENKKERCQEEEMPHHPHHQEDEEARKEENEEKTAPYEKECKNLLSSSEDPLHTISSSHQEEIHPQGLPRRRRRGGDIREHGHGNEAFP